MPQLIISAVEGANRFFGVKSKDAHYEAEEAFTIQASAATAGVVMEQQQESVSPTVSSADELLVLLPASSCSTPTGDEQQQQQQQHSEEDQRQQSGAWHAPEAVAVPPPTSLIEEEATAPPLCATGGSHEVYFQGKSYQFSLFHLNKAVRESEEREGETNSSGSESGSVATSSQQQSRLQLQRLQSIVDPSCLAVSPFSDELMHNSVQSTVNSYFAASRATNHKKGGLHPTNHAATYPPLPYYQDQYDSDSVVQQQQQQQQSLIPNVLCPSAQPLTTALPPHCTTGAATTASDHHQHQTTSTTSTTTTLSYNWVNPEQLLDAFSATREMTAMEAHRTALIASYLETEELNPSTPPEVLQSWRHEPYAPVLARAEQVGSVATTHGSQYYAQEERCGARGCETEGVPFNRLASQQPGTSTTTITTTTTTTRAAGLAATGLSFTPALLSPGAANEEHITPFSSSASGLHEGLRFGTAHPLGGGQEFSPQPYGYQLHPSCRPVPRAVRKARVSPSSAAPSQKQQKLLSPGMRRTAAGTFNEAAEEEDWQDAIVNAHDSHDLLALADATLQLHTQGLQRHILLSRDIFDDVKEYQQCMVGAAKRLYPVQRDTDATGGDEAADDMDNNNSWVETALRSTKLRSGGVEGGGVSKAANRYRQQQPPKGPVCFPSADLKEAKYFFVIEHIPPSVQAVDTGKGTDGSDSWSHTIVCDQDGNEGTTTLTLAAPSISVPPRLSYACSPCYYKVNAVVVLDGDLGVEMGRVVNVMRRKEVGDEYSSVSSLGDELFAWLRIQQQQGDSPPCLQGIPPRLLPKRFLALTVYREVRAGAEETLYSRTLPYLNACVLAFVQRLKEQHKANRDYFKACDIAAMHFDRCEFQADGKKLIVYYHSDVPVRFLELATHLHHVFRCRVWMKDVGETAVENRCEEPSSAAACGTPAAAAAAAACGTPAAVAEFQLPQQQQQPGHPVFSTFCSSRIAPTTPPAAATTTTTITTTTTTPSGRTSLTTTTTSAPPSTVDHRRLPAPVQTIVATAATPDDEETLLQPSYLRRLRGKLVEEAKSLAVSPGEGGRYAADAAKRRKSSWRRPRGEATSDADDVAEEEEEERENEDEDHLYYYVISHHTNAATTATDVPPRLSYACSPCYYKVNAVVVLDGDLGVEMGRVVNVMRKKEVVSQLHNDEHTPVSLAASDFRKLFVYREARGDETVLHRRTLPHLNGCTLSYIRLLKKNHIAGVGKPLFDRCDIAAMHFDRCEFQADGRKLMVSYHGDTRVRFLELATHLQHLFRCRVWLSSS